MHPFDTKSGDSLAPTEAETFEVNQVHNEAIQSELDRSFKKGVRALAIAMKYAN